MFPEFFPGIVNRQIKTDNKYPVNNRLFEINVLSFLPKPDENFLQNILCYQWIFCQFEDIAVNNLVIIYNLIIFLASFCPSERMMMVYMPAAKRFPSIAITFNPVDKALFLFTSIRPCTSNRVILAIWERGAVMRTFISSLNRLG